MVLTETESIFGAPLSRHFFVTFPSLLHLHSFPPCLFPARSVRVEKRCSAAYAYRACAVRRLERKTAGGQRDSTFFLLHTYLSLLPFSPSLSFSLFSLSLSLPFPLSPFPSASLFLPFPLPLSFSFSHSLFTFRLYAEPLSDFALRRTLCCCPTLLFLPFSPFPPSPAPHTHPLLRDGRLSEPKHAADHSSHRGRPTSIRQFSSTALAFQLDNSGREP